MPTVKGKAELAYLVFFCIYKLFQDRVHHFCKNALFKDLSLPLLLVSLVLVQVISAYICDDISFTPLNQQQLNSSCTHPNFTTRLPKKPSSP